MHKDIHYLYILPVKKLCYYLFIIMLNIRVIKHFDREYILSKLKIKKSAKRGNFLDRKGENDNHWNFASFGR